MIAEDDRDLLGADDARILAVESPVITGHTLKLNILEPGAAPLDVDARRESVLTRLTDEPRATPAG